MDVNRSVGKMKSFQKKKKKREKKKNEKGINLIGNEKIIVERKNWLQWNVFPSYCETWFNLSYCCHIRHGIRACRCENDLNVS